MKLRLILDSLCHLFRSNFNIIQQFCIQNQIYILHYISNQEKISESMSKVCRSCGKYSKSANPTKILSPSIRIVSPQQKLHNYSPHRLSDRNIIQITAPKKVSKKHIKKQPILPTKVEAQYGINKIKQLIQRQKNGEIHIKSQKFIHRQPKFKPNSQFYKQLKSSTQTKIKKTRPQISNPIQEYALVNHVQANTQRIIKLQKQLSLLKNQINLAKNINLKKYDHYQQKIKSSSSSSSGYLSSSSQQQSNSQKYVKNSLRKKESKQRKSYNSSQNSSKRCIGRFTKTYTSQMHQSSQIQNYTDPKRKQFEGMYQLPKDLNIYQSFNPHCQPKILVQDPSSDDRQLNPPKMERNLMISQRNNFESINDFGQNQTERPSISSKGLEYSNSSLRYRSD